MSFCAHNKRKSYDPLAFDAMALQTLRANNLSMRHSMSAASSGAPCRVLIVEDEMLIALMLKDMVAEAGLSVAAIANTLRGGVDIAAREDVQLGILDINLNGEE